MCFLFMIIAKSRLFSRSWSGCLKQQTTRWPFYYTFISPELCSSLFTNHIIKGSLPLLRENRCKEGIQLFYLLAFSQFCFTTLSMQQNSCFDSYILYSWHVILGFATPDYMKIFLNLLPTQDQPKAILLSEDNRQMLPLLNQTGKRMLAQQQTYGWVLNSIRDEQRGGNFT